MSVRTRQQRRSPRAAAAHAVAICDRRGHLLLRGRTSHISESGLLCVTEARRGLRVRGKVIVEIALPPDGSPRLRHNAVRTVRHLARVVRAQEIGQLVGIALELIRKLS